MKKVLGVIMMFLMFVALTGCGFATPDAGTEAVLVMKPIFFGHGGVDPEPVRTGRTTIAWTTTPIYVNMQPVQKDLKVTDMMSADGVPLHFDAIIRFRVTDSVKLVEKFGPNAYSNNVEQEFFNQIRQQIRQHGMNDMAINTKSIEEVDTNVTKGMQEYFTKTKLPLEIVAITVGKVNPPDAVRDQRVATAQQEQRVNTERQRKLAEDSRMAAETSRAKADDAYRQAMNLTPAQFVQLEQIKMLESTCAGNEGKNCTFILNGGVMPTITVK